MRNKLPAMNSSGFTLVELLVVLAMVTVIISLTSINLTGLISDTSIDETAELITSDIKRQQLRAMIGEEHQNFSTFGVHFDSDRYVLFSGVAYDPNASTNTVVSLPTGLEFDSITLSGGTIVFLPQSGEVLNYNSSADTFIIRHAGAAQTKQFEFNSLGVIEVL